jgi:hypothetical protein
MANIFIDFSPEQAKKIESLYHEAAKHFGGRVVGSVLTGDLSVNFTCNTIEEVANKSAGFANSLLTSVVNEYIAGREHPELSIGCDPRGNMTFRFLPKPAP